MRTHREFFVPANSRTNRRCAVGTGVPDGPFCTNLRLPVGRGLGPAADFARTHGRQIAAPTMLP